MLLHFRTQVYKACTEAPYAHDQILMILRVALCLAQLLHVVNADVKKYKSHRHSRIKDGFDNGSALLGRAKIPGQSNVNRRTANRPGHRTAWQRTG